MLFRSATEEAYTHVCPLCESTLAEPLSEDKIQEHVDWMLGVINENFDIVGESLEEDTETEEDLEETEEESYEDE